MIGEIEDSMFSSFLEHLGRAIYGGIYEPNHPTADGDGFRNDVAKLVEDLQIDLVRYPGGNFVSNYNWEDGIGPRSKRPTKKEEAWKSLEPNWIGIDEFMLWSKKVNIKPMIAINLGTGTVDSAHNLIQYCNANDNSYYASLRRKFGSKEPYNINYWCLGNEMDGDWQIGHMPCLDYCQKAHLAAQKMREVDPNAKFIVCGSSSIDMITFPEWDRTVCENLYDDMDYLSIHQYFYESTTENDYYASYLAMNNYIDILRSVIKYAKAKNHSKKDIYFCFDEYNIWYNNKKLEDNYSIAPPLLEEFQSVKDTIVFSGLLNTLLNNCDVVKIACLAQLVNVIAPIMTQNKGMAIKNLIYYPYYYFSRYCRGVTLKSSIIKGDKFASRFGEAYYVSEAVVQNKEGIVVLLTNYAEEEMLVNVQLGGYKNIEVIEHLLINGGNLNAKNTFESPETVVPKKAINSVVIQGENVDIKIPPFSWNIVRLKAD